MFEGTIPPTVERRLVPVLLVGGAMLALLASRAMAGDPDQIPLFIGAGAAALLAPVSLIHFDIAVAGLVFLLPFASLGAFPGIDLTVVPLAGVGLAFGWLTRFIILRSPLAWDRTLWMASLFLLVSIGSAIAGDYSPDPLLGRLPTLRVIATYVQLFGLTFIMVQTVRSRRPLLYMAWAVLLSTTIMAGVMLLGVFGLIQFAGIEYYHSGGVVRVAAFVGGAARTSVFMITGLVVGAFLLRIHRDPVLRLVLLGCISALALTHFLTVSLTGSIVGAAALALWFGVGREGIGVRRLAMAGVVFSVLVASMLLFSDPVRERVNSRIDQIRDQPVTSWLSGRVGVWWAGLNVVATHPLGVGPGNSNLYMIRYLPPADFLKRMLKDDPQYDPHSTYISVAGDQGLVGIFLFLLMLLFSVRWYRVAIDRAKHIGDEQLYWLAWMGLVVLCSILLFGAFVSFQRVKYLWIFVGVGAGLGGSASEANAAAPVEGQP